MLRPIIYHYSSKRVFLFFGYVFFFSRRYIDNSCKDNIVRWMMYLVNSNKRKGELERIDYKLYDCSCPNCIRQKPCNEFFPSLSTKLFLFFSFLPLSGEKITSLESWLRFYISTYQNLRSIRFQTFLVLIFPIKFYCQYISWYSRKI